jgi:glycosyltransferase involved in cell wall biosynthesis
MHSREDISCLESTPFYSRMSTCPMFSIVTSTFNVGDALSMTARSLKVQTCQSFEWLIVDGASNDETLAHAREWGDLVTVLVSEPDTGIYNAWNKLLPRLRGQWVLFLGAGDTLYAANTLEKVAAILEQLPPETTTVCGDVTLYEASTGADLRISSPTWRGLYGPWAGGRPYMPYHQGVLQRARVFSEFRFDERLRICADSEIVLRELLAGHGAKLDVMVARFDVNGISSNPRNRLRKVSEFLYINWKVGISHVRPIHQALVLLANALVHPWRVWRTRQRRG